MSRLDNVALVTTGIVVRRVSNGWIMSLEKNVGPDDMVIVNDVPTLLRKLEAEVLGLERRANEPTRETK